MEPNVDVPRFHINTVAPVNNHPSIHGSGRADVCSIPTESEVGTGEVVVDGRGLTPATLATDREADRTARPRRRVVPSPVTRFLEGGRVSQILLERLRHFLTLHRASKTLPESIWSA